MAVIAGGDADPKKIGPYVVTGRLGRGANSQLYRVTSTTTGEVAVKVMRLELTDAVAMMTNEFETERRIDPEFVASPIGFGADQDRGYLMSRFHPRHSALTGAKRGSLTATDVWRIAAGVAPLAA